MGKRTLFAALCLGSLLGMNLPGQEPPGIPVFGDDFNVPGLFVENIEGRGVEVKDGKIADKFKPLERHVYVIGIEK